MEDKHLISGKEAGILYLFLAVMLAVGSIFDYPISQALYNESNLFGIFFAAYGEYPAMLGFVAAGALLIVGRNREKKLIGLLPRLNKRFAGKRRLLVGIGFAWACIVAFSRIIMGAHYLTDTVIGLSVGLACLILVDRIVFRGKAAAK